MSFIPHPPSMFKTPVKPTPRDLRPGGRLAWATIGFVGLFIVRLRARVRILLTKAEVASYTNVYNRAGMGMHSVRLIKEQLMGVGALLDDHQFRVLLQRVGYKLNAGLTLDQWLRIIMHIKRNEVIEAKLSTDTHNAFSALGGNVDGGGVVDAVKFRNLIKDFDLGVDVDQLIANADTDHSGQLDYMEFVGILTEMFGKEEEAPKSPLLAKNRGGHPQKTNSKKRETSAIKPSMARTAKRLSGVLSLRSAEEALHMLRALVTDERSRDNAINALPIGAVASHGGDEGSSHVADLNLRSSTIALHPHHHSARSSSRFSIIPMDVDYEEEVPKESPAGGGPSAVENSAVAAALPCRKPKTDKKSGTQASSFTMLFSNDNRFGIKNVVLRDTSSGLVPLPPPTGSPRPRPARHHRQNDKLRRRDRYKAYAHDELHKMNKAEFKEQKRQAKRLEKQRRRKRRLQNAVAAKDDWEWFSPFQKGHLTSIAYADIRQKSAFTEYCGTSLPVLAPLKRLLERPMPPPKRGIPMDDKGEVEPVGLPPIVPCGVVPVPSERVSPSPITAPEVVETKPHEVRTPSPVDVPPQHEIKD